MNAVDLNQTARKLAITWLGGEVDPTPQLIRDVVGQVVEMLRARHPATAIDAAALLRDVESACNVWVPDMTALDDATDHLDWLPAKKADIRWDFWERYRRYLLEFKRFAPETLRRLDEATDEVLKRLEDPHRTGAWDRRGMIVGQVQSGKTSNYTGLICKAADAGYRLIVVLAGSHNSLRSQTQLRLDEGFLGFDTQQRMEFDQSNTRIGVGAMLGARFYIAHTLTSSEERGDFNIKVAEGANVTIGGSDPVLLVVKKNQSILNNLTKWATRTHGEALPGTNRKVVKGVPLLVIDDEADNASVNTKLVPLDENGQPDPEFDPTKINGQIRQLLHTFEQSAYVGYTATPFANIFMPFYRDVDASKYGEDLFPRSFIINLPAPSNYMGPAQTFGLAGDDAASMKEQPALPVVRTVDDYDGWIPNDHKNGYVPGPLPPSLKQAIRAFVLACASRAARGQAGDHNSMLIHVTRFTSVQREVAAQVKDELSTLRERIRYGDGASPHQLMDELRALWEEDFLPTTAAFADPGLTVHAFDEVAPFLGPAVEKIQTLTVNGTAKDALAYYENRHEGLSCIAVGGDKLSRGLTLEGLSVSYYLRASRMYDTLMQMGRWFGYRPGYADLCRLYITDELAGWYKDITAASEELRREFDYMAHAGLTPEDYGLRVKSHPDGLMVTAGAKMRNATKIVVSFSKAISETVAFHRDRATIESNFAATEALLESLGPADPPDGSAQSQARTWKAASAGDIVAFLQAFKTHLDARKAQASLLAAYIQKQVASGGLTDWTVLLASGDGPSATIAGCSLALVARQQFPAAEHLAPSASYQIKRLVSPRDEMRDLSVEKVAKALHLTRDAWHKDKGRSRRQTEPEVPSGLAIRTIRPPTRGLLLLYPLDPAHAQLEFDGSPPIIGIAVSFPPSIVDDAAVEYEVNWVYWQQEFAEL